MDPEVYLRHVMERIADHPINAIADLLPWNVAAALAEIEQKKAACPNQHGNVPRLDACSHLHHCLTACAGGFLAGNKYLATGRKRHAPKIKEAGASAPAAFNRTRSCPSN